MTKLLSISLIGTLGLVFSSFASAAHGLPYGAGSYGSCQYSSCGITLTSSSSVAANVTPVGTGTTCTVRSDSVSVTTGASTGFTVTLKNSDDSNNMAGPGGNSIAPVGGTAASPTALGAKTWGYRVDGRDGFGAGPTSAVTNAAVPSQAFAAVPRSSGTAGTVKATTAAAPTANVTNVWYGVCTNITLPSGSYSDQVTYTAVTN